MTNDEVLMREMEKLPKLDIDWSKDIVEHSEGRVTRTIGGRLAMLTTDGINWDIEEWFQPFMRVGFLAMKEAAFESGY